MLLIDLEFKNVTHYRNLPNISLHFDEGNIREVNELLDDLKECQIEIKNGEEYRNKTDDLLNKYHFSNESFCYYYLSNTNLILDIHLECGWSRVCIASITQNQNKYNPKYCYNAFNKICMENHIDLRKYMKNYTKDEVIEMFGDTKPLTDVLSSQFISHSVDDMIIFDDCNHIDYNTFFFSSLIELYPEFKKVVSELYAKRKDDNELYKSILTMNWGYFQSINCGEYVGKQYALAHLSYQMLKRSNEKLLAMKVKLEDNDRVPLLLNTDGIWYQGDLFSDENEGTELGQYKNDHTNCQLLIKGKGSYAFIENGELNVVNKGLSRKLKDNIKTFEDFLNFDVMKEVTELNKRYYFDEKNYKIELIKE